MKCCRKCPPRKCCQYPRCLLGETGQKPTPQVEQLKKYLSLPFPEDDF